jgi:oxygen-independent coproporphyrinogen-3 oxidase
MLDTLIQKGRIPQVDDDETIKHYNALQQWIADNGFVQYEISNYSKQGFEAKHNSRYWDSTPYLGVGTAAHSFDGCSRQWNIDNVDKYIEGVNSGALAYTAEQLSQKDRYNEYIMTALRTSKGLDKQVLANYQQYWEVGEKLLTQYICKGLMCETEYGYKLSAQGFLFADAIAADLFCL